MTRPAARIAPPQMIPLQEVAAALAMDERTVRRKIGSTGRDRLPAAKIGGRWKVRLSDLEAYIDAHTTNATRKGAAA